LNCFRLISIPGAPGLHPAHELVQLARKLALSPEGIDWDRFEAAFAGGYSPDMGAPGKATRLMVGLQYLKFTFNESDESVVARWVENPYGQYFCGYTHLQHECPIHPTSMSRWRKRVGADRLVELLQETIALAKREGHVSHRDLGRVNVDTTVQEKNITYRGHGCTAAVNVHLPGQRSGGSRAERRRRRHSPSWPVTSLEPGF
jgi:IS5 family transposase